MDSSRESMTPDESGLADAPAKSQGKFALALGMIAIALSLVFGIVYLVSVRRLDREVARLREQTEGLSRTVVHAQEQSQTFAEQASQAGISRWQSSPGRWRGSASRRKVSAGWSCAHRSNRRPRLNTLRKRLRTRRPPLNSATWRSRIKRTQKHRHNWRGSRPRPSSKRQSKLHR